MLALHQKGGTLSNQPLRSSAPVSLLVFGCVCQLWLSSGGLREGRRHLAREVL
jgi:hypothetical protein